MNVASEIINIHVCVIVFRITLLNSPPTTTKGSHVYW